MKWVWWLLGGLGAGFAIVKLTEPKDTPPFPYVEIGPKLYLTATAGNAFNQMQAAANAVGIKIPIVTAWRSGEWQARLYDAYRAFIEGRGPWAPEAAAPGKSYHEKGLAIDIDGVNPAKAHYDAGRDGWLKANASRFNFFNTGAYFKTPEPHHWVYGVQREGGALVA